MLRGGRSGPNYTAEHIEKASQLLAAAGLPQRLLVDCSHGNSNKDHNRQSLVLRDLLGQRMAGDSRIAGVMVESNLQPGAQKLTDNPANLERGISITDACIGWEETEELVNEAYEAATKTAPASGIVAVGGE